MQANHRDTLKTCLTQIFGRVEDSFVDEALPLLDWIELGGSQTLFEEGDKEGGVYFVISGRLRATVKDGDRRVTIGEIARGETVGEMAVLTGEPRSATVAAIRDSVLAHVPKDAFDILWHKHPELTVHMAKIVISRLKRSSGRDVVHRPTTLCVVGATDGLDLLGFGAELLAALRRWGVCALESSASIEKRFGEGAAGDAVDEEVSHKVTLWLDDVEFWNEYVILIADDEDTAWTRRCLRVADEVFVLADADAPVAIGALEAATLTAENAITGARQTLLLLHPEGKERPSGTTEWLDRRPIDTHFHLRAGRGADIQRLARIISGNSIGLVLAGGGARGFAHLGVYKAMHEAGISVDFFGGTSIGSCMAALMSYDEDPDTVIERARKAFSKNPTSDFTLLPVLSLFKGRKLRRIVDGAVAELAGSEESDVADSWKTLYCVATNYTTAQEKVLLRGPLKRAVRASVSIPVALPPLIWDGEILVDGGVLNNFPTDIMQRWNVGRLIGVDLSRTRTRRYDFEEVPGPFALLIDKFLPRSKQRYKLPTLGAILMGTTILYSESRRENAASKVDIYMNPDLARVGLLQWKSFDRIVDIGYQHAKEQLAAMNESELAPYRDSASANS